ncbi:DNA-binding protein [Aquisalimonas sp.]|uniref:FitA-like ribbon-helix-helix domain-containing protein n=1 Tax=Aquisalimonas sp. TaxID=1872621 RepID=UPI0025C4F685|nr:DNA-binding protein [Aquisalimonas sp.]
MANLVVRNVDDRIAQALKERAARHNRSAEAEHRAILEQALVKTRRKSLAEVLASMPDLGRDEDFDRVDDKYGNAPRVFD